MFLKYYDKYLFDQVVKCYKQLGTIDILEINIFKLIKKYFVYFNNNFKMKRGNKPVLRIFISVENSKRISKQNNINNFILKGKK
jgi:hypothetical protein